jgi:23S rRNA pseudouridine1911/1915/1917 synthase
LIRAIPQTGRTHQIRVHLASLGYPIVGDKIYGPDEKLYLEFIETGWTAKLERQLLLPRHALHSAKLGIENGQQWTSAPPAEMFAPFS